MIKKQNLLKYTTLLVIASLIFILASCGNAGTANVPVQDILDEQIKLLNEDIIQITDDVIYTYYDIDENDIESIVCAKSGNGAIADEVTVIKVKDGNNKKIKEALELRKTMITNAFFEYNPDEKEKIDNCIIEEKGNYILLAVCDNAEEIKSVFNANLS